MDAERWERYRDEPVEVSDRGNVRSLAPGPRRYRAPIKPVPNAAGYLIATWRVGGGKRRSRAVHRMVLETFGPRRKAGEQCRHLDGNRTHNALGNLAWGTAQQNTEDRKMHRSGSDRLTWREAGEIRRFLAAGISQRKVATAFGVSQSAVACIALNKTWRPSAAEIPRG